MYENIEINTNRWYDLTPLKNEVFKEIEGYENRYQVSNYGRVKCCERTYKQNHGYRNVKEKILKAVPKNNDYLRVSFRTKEKIKYFMIHRLVGKAFLPNPDNKPQINHKDKNRQNNLVDNLEWVTAKENVYHEFGWDKNENTI